MSSIKFLDLTLPTLAENLALDEALLLDADRKDRECLRFWHWSSPAVILGAGCRVAEDVNVNACEADAVPIVRRSSGGGTVLLGRGCLLYTLVVAYERAPELGDLRGSYRWILSRMVKGLSALAPGAASDGISDLVCRAPTQAALATARKFSGNAQQRKRRYLLHHGTLLFDFDLAQVERYLRMPTRQPDYREYRGHGEFLMNLNCREDELRMALRKVWQASEPFGELPSDLVKALVGEKYASDEWNRRR